MYLQYQCQGAGDWFPRARWVASLGYLMDYRFVFASKIKMETVPKNT